MSKQNEADREPRVTDSGEKGNSGQVTRRQVLQGTGAVLGASVLASATPVQAAIKNLYSQETSSGLPKEMGNNPLDLLVELNPHYSPRLECNSIQL